MNIQQLITLIVMLPFTSCDNITVKNKTGMHNEAATTPQFESGHAPVNGINMYYEIHGAGYPLVLIHGGGSTISSTFGRILPELAKKHKVIAMELQNHGRTDTRDVPETFEQDAEDVLALLNILHIQQADFFGFSNGGQTALQIAIHHPEVIRKLIIGSAPYKRAGFIPGFFEGMPHASLDNMPPQLKEDFLAVNPDTAKLEIMFRRDKDRMIHFKGWTDEEVESVQKPTLLISGNADVLTPEHAIEMHRRIRNSELAILPGGHGAYIGEVTTLTGKDSCCALPIIESFLGDTAQ